MTDRLKVPRTNREATLWSDLKSLRRKGFGSVGKIRGQAVCPERTVETREVLSCING